MTRYGLLFSYTLFVCPWKEIMAADFAGLLYIFSSAIAIYNYTTFSLEDFCKVSQQAWEI